MWMSPDLISTLDAATRSSRRGPSCGTNQFAVENAPRGTKAAFNPQPKLAGVGFECHFQSVPSALGWIVFVKTDTFGSSGNDDCCRGANKAFPTSITNIVCYFTFFSYFIMFTSLGLTFFQSVPRMNLRTWREHAILTYWWKPINVQMIASDDKE